MKAYPSPSISTCLMVAALILIPPLCVKAQTTKAHNWQVTAFAGTGEKGFSGDGGPATRAQLNNPFGVVRWPDGAIYFCDTSNHRIRKVGADGKISTVAGSGVTSPLDIAV